MAGSAAVRWSRSSGPPSATASGRPELIEKQFERPGSEAWREIAEVFRSRTRDEWRAFNDEHDCCIEPILDLDEALDSELVREREMVVELEQPEIGPVRQLGVPIKLSPHPRQGGASGAGPGRAHRGGAAGSRLLRGGDRLADLLGGRGGDVGGAAVLVPGMTERTQARRAGAGKGSNGAGGLLRMKELAEASGVPAPTIKHYLREGLLPEPVKTSRNMAYYPPEFVDRIRLIKRLQEERYMPLRAIKTVLDEGPDRARALIEIEDRILERALEGERTRTSAAEVRKAYGVPKEVLDRLEKLEILSPNSRGYSPSDVKVIEAISRFRAGGYDEEIGFTVYDTLRYKRALEQLVKEEVGVLTERLAGEMEPERVAELIEAGAEPLKDLIAALHTKLLIAELERQPRT